jgi:hypothetical protein
MLPLPVILESQDDMSVVDGATIEPRIRINDPTTRMQDAGFQVSGVSPKIALNSRSHLQHVQRPTPSHLRKDAPSISRVGYEHVARSFENIQSAELSCSFNDVTMPLRDADREPRR